MPDISCAPERNAETLKRSQAQATECENEAKRPVCLLMGTCRLWRVEEKLDVELGIYADQQWICWRRSLEHQDTVEQVSR